MFIQRERVITKVAWFAHLLLLAPVYRSIRIVILGLRIRGRDESLTPYHYQMLVSLQLDQCLANFIRAFLEDAPQLVLHLYIWAQKHSFDYSNWYHWLMAVKIAISIMSLAWGVASYVKYLRISKPDSATITLKGAVMITLWRAFMVSSRMVVLVAFTLKFKGWLFVLFLAHIILIFLFLLKQRLYFFDRDDDQTKYVKKIFMKLLVAYVHFFAYFSIEGKETRKWAIPFYTLMFGENAVLNCAWFFYDPVYSRSTFDIGVFSYGWAGFLLGISCMCLYYRFLHPTMYKNMRNCSGEECQIESCSGQT